jgi:aspartate kinase
MSVVVQKFGGTSMGDPERIGKAADRVVAARESGHEVVVVVSAMGRTTDELMALADRITTGRCDRERDMLVSVGERIATALLCMALQARGWESISFTGSQAGILTNDRHQDASIIEVRPVRVQDELSRGKVVVVAGYQGMSYKREITTLRRGGSDTTAIALAAALGAAWVEVYSDVDGVYTADPRKVPEAVRIDELDVDAMASLSRGGARVLAEDAVAMARREGIVLYCRATDPSQGTGQTLVRRFPPEDRAKPAILAVTSQVEGLTLQRCAPGDIGLGLGELADRDAVIRLVSVAGDGAAIVSEASGTEDEVGLITVVGRALDVAPGLVGEIAALLRSAGARCHALVVGPDDVRIAVDAALVADLVREIHAAWLQD